MWLMIALFVVIAVLTLFAFITDNQSHTYTSELICRALCVCAIVAYFNVWAGFASVVLTYIYFRFVRKYD